MELAITRDWYIQPLRQYAVFTGRAPRNDSLLFLLTCFLSACAFNLIGNALGLPNIYGYSISGIIFVAVVIVPFTALIVRRLHDANFSGLWIFIAFIPASGVILMTVFLSFNSQPGTNRFGPNPKDT